MRCTRRAPCRRNGWIGYTPDPCILPRVFFMNPSTLMVRTSSHAHSMPHTYYGMQRRPFRPSHNRCTVHPVRVGHTPWPSGLPSGVCLGTPAGVICLRLHRQATGPSPPRARDPSRVNSRDIVQRTAPPADSPSGPSWARWAALGESFRSPPVPVRPAVARGWEGLCRGNSLHAGGAAEHDARGHKFFMLYPAVPTNSRSSWVHRKLPESVPN